MKSPCIDVCKFDRETDFCLGCGRTRKEAKKWKKLAKAERRAITAVLGERLAQLGPRASTKRRG